MNLFCIFFDHDWRYRKASRDLYCANCRIDARNPTPTLAKLFHFATRRRLWEVRSKVYTAWCWLLGHNWRLSIYTCKRCNVTEEMIEDGEVADTLPSTLRAKWRAFKRLFQNATGYVPGSNAREDRQRRTWRNYFFTAFGQRWGFQYAPLFINDRPYMTRWICYLGPINLRVHQFFRGDDDRAPHNHPWWFITFPFHTYVEAGFEKGVYKGVRFVKKWRFHYRPHTFEHIVLGPAITGGFLGLKAWSYKGAPLVESGERPFWTFVIAGSKAGDWGFYPEPNKFVPWWEFKP